FSRVFRSFSLRLSPPLSPRRSLERGGDESCLAPSCLPGACPPSRPEARAPAPPAPFGAPEPPVRPAPCFALLGITSRSTLARALTSRAPSGARLDSRARLRAHLNSRARLRARLKWRGSARPAPSSQPAPFLCSRGDRAQELVLLVGVALRLD